MDNIDFSKAGGYPLTQDTLEFLQNTNLDSLKNSFAHLADCTLTAGMSVNGNTVTVNPGVILLNGEPLRVEADSFNTQLGILVWYIDETNHPTLDPTQYADSTQHNVHRLRSARLGYNAPANSYKTIAGSVPDVYTLLAQGLDSADWVNASLQNGWSNIGTRSGITYHDAMYRKDKFGMVHMRGNMSSNGPAAQVLFTLAGGYYPSKMHRYPAILYNAATELQGIIEIAANGEVSLFVSQPSTGYAADLSLDGLSFYLI